MNRLTKTVAATAAGAALIATLALPVLARPAKDDFNGKTAGNSGFANIVGDNSSGEITGWVRYSKNSKSFHTTWGLWGLEPGAEYQLKLHSKNGDANVADACGDPNGAVPWQCGVWGGTESFLVMATVNADTDGHIGLGVKESRLPIGDYIDMQFIVTRNSSPWDGAWTWENSADSGSDPWSGDISTFTIVN